MRSLVDEFGLRHVSSSHSVRDVLLLFASRFVRMLAFGAVSPILVLHLRLIGLSDTRVGSFLSLTLLGDVLLSLVVTWTADTLGRRRVLALGAFLMAASGVVFHYSSSYVPLLLAAIIGIISPTGNEVGPFSAVETGMLSQLVEPEARVYVLMWYQFLGFVGTSVGSVCSGALVTSLERSGRSLVTAYRAVFYLYTATALLKIVLSLALTSYTEVDHPPITARSSTSAVTSTTTRVAGDGAIDPERQPLLSEQASPSVVTAVLDPPPQAEIKARLPIVRLALLSILFSIDSFASSLAPLSFTSYYLRLAYDAPLSTITSTFSAGSMIAGFSQLAAGSIARRLGIILTMVGTHSKLVSEFRPWDTFPVPARHPLTRVSLSIPVPAQILTIALAFAPTLKAAIVIFLGRAATASMDSGVRGAFLSAIIPKDSRTRFLGIINVCKTLASAPGPTVSGHLAARGAQGLRWSFVLCGGLKILYDLGLLVSFRAYKMEH
ncbi:BQ5605_C021g09324 [Microbotryum silenes-dioicae]|uniref:BQ5605_C021g09324 protein n=1 Tax=Microbotryum silenes-dioicae TaxID=796604 RepID=A0A2X0ND17_9BASI|nr:BQ5605_C021g09324 [Microbotryum silenes-dioicae]